MRTRVAAIVVVGMVSGCQYGPYQFTCTDDASCGPGGKCEPGFNLCSFADHGCPSGRSFGSLGGANSGQCVGSQPLPDGGPPDAPPDARVCYGTGLVSVCFATPPTTALMISAPMTIDTTSSSLCAPTVGGGTGYCVLAATEITITAKLRATGAKPLVLIASRTINIMGPDGVIDVASHRGQNPETGAGADFDTCISGTSPANTGGGAGGSFRGAGGTGGSGGGAGGSPGTITIAPTVLRGGCPGQGGQGVEAGVGGHGGGAVFLIARAEIDIEGFIDASGEGGAGGQTAAGGGGGGAGGMIGFDAPTITAMGTSLILADGGGGGGGGDLVSDSSHFGAPGSDPTTIAAAAGGRGGSEGGGEGGAGSAGAAAGSGAPGNQGVAGGGGGGGAGLITAPAGANLGMSVSPAPTTP